ncbi:hypothetical protein [Neomegalonema sp.]|uniref:hypothetical protein n=1 Tax=Neomegalonema sp. TaxID=2039713 RepID=UPI002624B3D5|nr:hypothetical protein [Neomegalonema sp.]MDD2868808.1 hypothetical protein [Neomegalonema sp.]
MIVKGWGARAAGLAAGVLTASPAWAQVCAERKPDWDGLPVPWRVDLVEFLITPPGLGVIIVVCVALMFGRAWLLGLAAGLCAVVAALRFLRTEAADFAMGAEGCAPDPAVTGVVLAALALALAALALWRRRALRRL